MGAVAAASAAAAAPCGPWAASACRVEDEIVLPPPELPPLELAPPPEPPAPPEPCEPPEPCDPPPTGCTVLVGRLPPAVGIVSSYWLTPEFPGGAIVRTRA